MRVCFFVSWLVGQLVGQLVDWLVGWLAFRDGVVYQQDYADRRCLQMAIT